MTTNAYIFLQCQWSVVTQINIRLRAHLRRLHAARMARLAAIAAMAVGCSGATTMHTVLTFDYGWRFHLGEPGVSVERNCKAEHSFTCIAMLDVAPCSMHPWPLGHGMMKPSPALSFTFASTLSLCAIVGKHIACILLLGDSASTHNSHSWCAYMCMCVPAYACMCLSAFAVTMQLVLWPLHACVCVSALICILTDVPTHVFGVRIYFVCAKHAASMRSSSQACSGVPTHAITNQEQD